MHASTRSFWTLFNALPVGAVLFDPADDGFVEVNEAACQSLGYSREMFLKLRVCDIDLDRSDDELRTARRALTAHSAPQQFRTRQRAADGSSRIVEVKVQTIVLNERVLGYAVWQDVTEQQRAIDLLRERELELARVQRIGRVGGFEVDPNGFHKYSSPEYLKLHGLPSGAIDEPHKAWLRRLHPDDRDRADR